MILSFPIPLRAFFKSATPAEDSPEVGKEAPASGDNLIAFPNERRPEMIPLTPANSIADEPSSVIDIAQLMYDSAVSASKSYDRQERARATALSLHRGEFFTYDHRLADEMNAMGIALDGIVCALYCNRPFQPGQRAVGWWLRAGGYNYAHLSCAQFAIRTGLPPTPAGQS